MTSDTASTPLFVVVGNVNQGKSSVVAALSENEAIPIDSYPGTTKHAGTYVFKSADRELFRIVDTPGFQRPRQLLAWLQARTQSAADRPGAVREFVETMADGGEFHDEVELLKPLLEGAGILYVVDASSHLEPSNEAEMEILRWTGQPAMALINRCLSDYPKGKIIGVEKSFSILQIGEHNVVLQWTTYHVGFIRRPLWLEEP